MTTSRISILLPTRNRPALLRRAIASALAQTYSDFELIVVDDGSTADTEEAVRSFADERIIYVRQECRGAAAAENTGLTMARGSFIAFLDDDDEWLPDKLRVQMEAFEREPDDTGVVYTGRWLVRNGRQSYGPPVKILSRNGRIHEELLRRETFVPLICALVRKECFHRVGVFDETLPTSNDYDLWIRISRHFRFKYIPQPLAIVHASKGSISTDPARIIAARKLLLLKHAVEFASSGRGITAYFLWQIGSLLLLQGNAAEGRRFLMHACRCRPWNAGYGASLLLSLAGPGMYRRCLLGPLHHLKHRLRSRPLATRAMTHKLLFVSFNLAGGGAERVLVNLIEGLDSRRFQSTCLFYDATEDYRLPDGVAAHTLGLPGSANRSRRIRRLAEIIDAMNPDVVFSFLTGVNIEVILAHRESGSRASLIVSEHNRSSVIFAGSQNDAKRTAVSTLYPRADLVIAVSAAIKRDLIEHFGLPAARIRVIHNPVDREAVNRLKTATPPPHHWPADRLPVVINVAAVKPRKGQDLLLSAFRIVRSRTPCHLMLVGSGTDEEAFRKDVEQRGLAADAMLLGFQANPFMLMARASVFVLPSRCEGFPNVLLEAMACGVPVITTNWAGADEIVIDGETGLVVPMDDDVQLADAIVRLLTDRELGQRFATAAAARLERFARPRVMRRYARLLDAYARRAHGRRDAVPVC